MTMYTPVNNYNTIMVKNYSDHIEEFTAYAAITPGMLVEEYSTANYIRKHSEEGGNIIPAFAIEDALQGKDIDDDYAAGDKVRVWFPQKGDLVYALLEDGERITRGQWLMSNGAGRLQLLDAETLSAAEALSVVGKAMETVDLSGSSGTETTQRILVRIA